MRIPFVLLLCALCLSRPAVSQPETITVPLLDKSEIGSPFQVSGRFVLEESLHGNQLEWSWAQKVAVKNISDKPIMLFVATLTTIGRYPRGQRAAPGDGPTYVIEDDRFFDEKLIRPSESLTLRDTEPGTPEVACCVNPSAKKDPVAQYYLNFVQFADGSTFGDPLQAQDVLALRETILHGLRELNQSSSEYGEQGFTAKLKEQSPFSATMPFRQILTTYGEGGVRAAIDKAKQILNAAERHAAAGSP